MKAKVMVVDDTDGVRDLIGTILQRNGYEPLPKANAAQLLASWFRSRCSRARSTDRRRIFWSKGLF